MRTITEFLINNRVQSSSTDKFDSIPVGLTQTLGNKKPMDLLDIEIYMNGSWENTIRMKLSDLTNNHITLTQLPEFVKYVVSHKEHFHIDKRKLKGRPEIMSSIKFVTFKNEKEAYKFGEYVYASDTYKPAIAISKFDNEYFTKFISQEPLPDGLN